MVKENDGKYSYLKTRLLPHKSKGFENVQLLTSSNGMSIISSPLAIDM